MARLSELTNLKSLGKGARVIGFELSVLLNSPTTLVQAIRVCQLTYFPAQDRGPIRRRAFPNQRTPACEALFEWTIVALRAPGGHIRSLRVAARTVKQARRSAGGTPPAALV
jgi:hypothetical protein